MMQATPLLLPVFVLLQFGLYSAGYEQPFGCNGTALTDSVRDTILPRINIIRALLAQDKYEPLASASDMNKLKWDCNLESIAGRVVQNCPRQFFRNISQRNAIYFEYYGPSERIRSDPIFESIEKWKKITLPLKTSPNIPGNSSIFLDFFDMLNENVTAVGCHSASCVDDTSTACVFSHPVPKDGDGVYTPGNPCVSGGNCKLTRLVLV
ncbi:hypothetical protein KIN20_008774 [Parelaphostrongylus tenuis]|uniref:SCP domain-containing protein n=1 Tax=Parelaphostrongylus tenuis TaxID=148309 RepID=A0AAD5MRM3_PARTN|nr:hypothetical protein KIN20_008774 [Parelaphostrongylus tenuis]